MADTDALKYKHRLFKIGQMVITRRTLKSYEDNYDGSLTTNGEDVPAETVMIVTSEGTSKGAGPFTTQSTYRSVMMLYVLNGVARERQILFNANHGPAEIGWNLFLSKEEFKK